MEAREAGHAEERAAGVCEPGGRVCERQRQDGHATLAGVAGGARPRCSGRRAARAGKAGRRTAEVRREVRGQKAWQAGVRATLAGCRCGGREWDLNALLPLD